MFLDTKLKDKRFWT